MPENDKHTHISIYVSGEDAKYWRVAKRLFPYFLDKSLSQFCAEAVREKVKELEANAEKNLR